MKGSKKIISKPNIFIALDQDLLVFAGYKNAYPYWSLNLDDAREINNEGHLNSLRRWFPHKTIEVIEI